MNSTSLISSRLSSCFDDTDTSGCSSLPYIAADYIPTSSFTPLAIKPHRSSTDSAYSAMLHRSQRLGLRDFRLHGCIGSGDIGTVFLCSLNSYSSNSSSSSSSTVLQAANTADGSNKLEEASMTYYAMKVVDKDVVEKKQKGQRAEMERRILKMVDHPFLPTLYADFEASRFSCIVMEYCSGGDLHSLRHTHPQNRFSLDSVRFYGAEVVVALEYLHMLGIIYRDLKPENILVRSDGHIMLSDFDLSLICNDIHLAVEEYDSSSILSSSAATCIPMMFRRRRSRKIHERRLVTMTGSANHRLIDFIGEPVSARSCSFVGTHEYVAPEVASGGSHGNAVDWWSLGILFYEMLYGLTPFAGPSNKATLRNIIDKSLSFPPPADISELHAQDLIAGLLCKDPSMRLGSKRGSAEVKKHPFFKDLNFALIRSFPPPPAAAAGPSNRKMYCTSQGTMSSSFHSYF